jgi:hypothetical protein
MVMLNVLYLFASAIYLPIHLYEAYKMICVFHGTIHLFKMQFVSSVAWKFYEILEQSIFVIQKQSMTFVTNGYTETWKSKCIVYRDDTRNYMKADYLILYQNIETLQERTDGLLRQEKYREHNIVCKLCPIFIKCILGKKFYSDVP